MKFFAFWCLLFVILKNCDSKPRHGLVYHNSEQTADGYHFQYETEDGQKREETGTLEYKGEEVVLHVRGFYSYYGTDGKQYTVYYQSDDQGFKREEDRRRFQEPDKRKSKIAIEDIKCESQEIEIKDKNKN